MEQANFKKFIEGKSKNNNLIHSKEQALADEIWRYFGKKISFGFLSRVIFEKGFQPVYESFFEVKQSNARSLKGLFLWKIKQLPVYKLSPKSLDKIIDNAIIEDMETKERNMLIYRDRKIEKLTFASIAKKHGITRQRVKQIVDLLYEKLNKPDEPI